MKMTLREKMFYDALLALIACGRAMEVSRPRMLEIVVRIAEAMSEVLETEAQR